MLYLLRHGAAERGDGDDAARRLTEEGERQSRAAGRAMAALGLGVDACLTSEKVRALDTARLACEPLGVEPQIQPELADSGYDATALATGLGDVVLVGHNPDFTTELQRITGANAKLRKGGLAIIDGSLLIALLRPEELEAIAEGAGG